MVERYRGGVVPQAELDADLEDDFEGLADRVAGLLDDVALTAALDEIWQRVRRLNRYVEERAPWQLAKEPAQADALDETLATLVEGLRQLTQLLSPYMPASTERLFEALARSGGRVSSLDPLLPKMT